MSLRNFCVIAVLGAFAVPQTSHAFGFLLPWNWNGKNKAKNAPITYSVSVQTLDGDPFRPIRASRITVTHRETGKTLTGIGNASGTATFSLTEGSYLIQAEALGFNDYEAEFYVSRKQSFLAYMTAGTTPPPPPPAGAPFDWNNVTIQSSLDVRDWAITSRITSVGFGPNRFHIDHTRRGLWPAVDIGGGTLQESTVWIFYNINGRWYGTGAQRMRPNQTDKDDLSNPSQIGPDWLYDPNRWGPMTTYVPQPGELIGVMITQGSLRSDRTYNVTERSGVVLFPMPRDGVISDFTSFDWEER